MDERADRRKRVVQLWLMTRMTFFQISTSWRFSSAVMRSTTIKRCSCMFNWKRRLTTRNVSSSLSFCARAPAARASSSASRARRIGSEHGLEQVLERPAGEPLQLPEELARGGVGVGNALPLVDEQDRHRRSLEKRLEEQLALVDLVSFAAQRVSEPIVGPTSSPSSSSRAALIRTPKSLSWKLRTPWVAARRVSLHGPEQARASDRAAERGTPRLIRA